ncbi:B3 domain-containing protein Os12g0591400 [Euphorbia peplus]|nr:B3 domain-containing protein Os12g0591400 [Euphorbia peplus]
MASSGKAFFRIILPTILQQNKMVLPSQFMAAYGDELPSEAKLVVPNGHVWQVQLTKENGEVMFRHGLTEFLQHYFICYGHLLVFEYMGSGTFSVRIFDNTTSEIQYTIAAPQNEEDGVEEEEEEEEEQEQDEMGEEESSDEEYAEGLGEEEEDLESDDEETDGSVEILGSDSPQRSRSRSRRSFPSANVAEVKRQHKIILGQKFDSTLSKYSQQTKSLVEAAMKMKPKNPSFMVIIMKNLIRNDVLFVPKSFANRHLRGHIKVKILNVDDEREWIVGKLLWRRHSLCLRKGLREFYRDNSLEEGDVCLFELVWVPDAVLKVSTFHTQLLD